MSTITAAELAEFKRLQAENEVLKAKLVAKQPKLTAKVSKSGAISIYGMGRFPVTLYKEQWAKLFGLQADIQALMDLSEPDFLKLQAEAVAKAATRPPYEAK